MDNFGLISKLFISVFVSFFLMLIIVSIIGTVLDRQQFNDLIGNSALPIWWPCLGVCVTYTIIKHFLFKKSVDK